LREGIGLAFVNDEAVRRGAGLPRVEVLDRSHLGKRQVDVGVVEYQYRRVSAQLHGEPLHMASRLLGQQLADGDGAGEGYFSYGLGLDEMTGNVHWIAVQQIQHARGQTGVDESANELGGRRRRFFGGFRDDRATGGQGGSELARQLIDGKVPWRKQ